MNPDYYISSGVLELYVAGVLPPEEMREIQLAVSQDPKLQAEVQTIETSLRSYAGIQAPPISRNLLADIKDKIQQQPAPAAEPKTVPIQQGRKKKEQVPPPSAAPEAAPERVRNYESISSPAPMPVEKARTNGFALWAAILTIFLLLSVGGNVYLYQQLQQAQHSETQANAERAQMADNMKAVQASYDQATAQLEIYQNPQYRSAQLNGTDAHPGMRALVFWNPKTQQVYLNIKDLPAAPSDKQYQLWALDENKNPVDAGMVPKDSAMGQLLQMKQIGNAQAFAITLEPMGGSSAPTMDQMYMSGNI